MNLPTTYELARLVAILNPGITKQPKDRRRLAIRSALELWNECHSELGASTGESGVALREPDPTPIVQKGAAEKRRTVAKAMPFVTQSQFKLPRKFPASFDDFLVKVVRRQKARREELFEKYIEYRLKVDTYPGKKHADGVSFKSYKSPSKVQIAKNIAFYRESGFEKERFVALAKGFEEWYANTYIPASKAIGGKARARRRKQENR